MFASYVLCFTISVQYRIKPEHHYSKVLLINYSTWRSMPEILFPSKNTMKADPEISAMVRE